MRSRSRDFSFREIPARLSPSEGWLVVQTMVLVAFSSWSFGGVVEWVQNGMLGLALAGLPLLWLRYRESCEFSVWPFVPAFLWLAFNTIAVLNPSHTPAAMGGWMPRSGWIPWLPTTTDVSHTLADARVWQAILVEAGLVAAVLRTARATRLIWGAIALNGFALAATGAFFHFSGAERMLGSADTPEPTYFFATFFYKNHWAAYGALAAFAATALALQAWPAALAGNPRARGRLALFGTVGLLTAVTLPLPGSRAGALMAATLVAGFFGSLWLGWWRTRRERLPQRALGFALLVAVGIVAFGANAYGPRAVVDLDRTQRQLAQHLDGENLDTRVLTSRDTWRMAVQRPWFGWGPGCFEIVFPVFQGNYLRGPDGRTQARFEFAHNDWLQLPAEVGFIGAMFLLVPVALTARRAWRRAGPAGRWALVGCGIVAAHGWIDFPFHNPAVLLLWVVMLVAAPCAFPAPASGGPSDSGHSDSFR